MTEGGATVSSTTEFELALDGTASGPSDSDYWVPRHLSLEGQTVRGRVRFDPILLRYDPLEDLPQPFRLLVSLTMRPHRAWMVSFIDVSVDAGSGDPSFRVHGSGTASVTFLKPLMRR